MHFISYKKLIVHLINFGSFSFSDFEGHMTDKIEPQREYTKLFLPVFRLAELADKGKATEHHPIEYMDMFNNIPKLAAAVLRERDREGEGLYEKYVPLLIASQAFVVEVGYGIGLKKKLEDDFSAPYHFSIDSACHLIRRGLMDKDEAKRWVGAAVRSLHSHAKKCIEIAEKKHWDEADLPSVTNEIFESARLIFSLEEEYNAGKPVEKRFDFGKEIELLKTSIEGCLNIVQSSYSWNSERAWPNIFFDSVYESYGEGGNIRQRRESHPDINDAVACSHERLRVLTERTKPDGEFRRKFERNLLNRFAPHEELNG